MSRIVALIALFFLALPWTAHATAVTVDSPLPHCIRIAQIVQPDPIDGNAAVFDDGQPADQTVTLDATYTPQSSGIHGYFHIRQIDSSNYLTLNINASSITFTKTSNSTGTTVTTTLKSVPFVAHVGAPVHVLVTASGSAITVSGDVSFSVTDTTQQAYVMQFNTGSGDAGTWSNISIGDDGKAMPGLPADAVWAERELTHPMLSSTLPTHNHNDISFSGQGTLDSVWTPSSTKVRGWITFDEQDSKNFDQLDFFSDHVAIAKRVNGTFINSVSSASFPIDAAHPIHTRLTMDGNTYTVTNLDTGVVLVTWTDTGAGGVPAYTTSHNFSFYTQSGSSSVWDHAEFYPGIFTGPAAS